MKPRMSSLTLVTLAYIAALGIMGANAVMLYRSLDVMRDHEKWVEHTQSVVLTLEQTISSLKDAETGERGFIITGEETYLRPFTQGRAATLTNLDLLQELVADNAVQAARLSTIRAKTMTLLNRFDELVELRRLKGFEATREQVSTGLGMQLMNEIRDEIRAMRATETDLLKDRTSQALVSAAALDRAITTDTTAILVILTLAYYFIRRFLVTQEAERLRLMRETWIKGGLAELSTVLRGNLTITALARETLNFFARYIGAPVGTFYINERTHLVLAGSYAGEATTKAKKVLKAGEGLAGEAANQNRIMHVTNVPTDYVKISSSLGDTPATHIIALPIVHQEENKGVLEFGALEPFSEQDVDLFKSVSETLGIAVDAAQTRDRIQQLLEETQRQAEELHAQQEELRTNNEELETQAQSLRDTQDRLQIQQEELRQTNEELEQQARVLESQKSDLSAKNQDLLVAQGEVERKAAELAQASQYKSEFLANMSHELRTPLNSMLILATLLAEDDEKRLTEKQVDFAKTIHRAGSDLLNLINDILDLSKVEAGKLDLSIEDVSLAQLAADMEGLFRPLAESKGLAFEVDVGAELPAEVRSDRLRLEQILKNFLSNAVKFTETGKITIAMHSNGDDRIALTVADTGIGIPEDKLNLVFDAFQQGDGSTSRQFGGTGLGLTISRELAALLQAEIKVTSTPGKGSRFTLVIPPAIAGDSPKPERPTLSVTTASAPAKGLTKTTDLVLPPASNGLPRVKAPVRGDVDKIGEKDRPIVIVEDDPDFGRVLLEHARDSGFKALLVGDGESAFELLSRYDVAGMLLDIRLPDVSGLAVLERLKANLKTRHVPVHIISGTDVSQNALKMGAVGYLMKPVGRNDLRQAFARIESTLSKEIKHVLIVEDDEVQRGAMIQLLAGRDIEIDAVGLGRAAIDKLSDKTYDCMILDLRLPDISGFELLELLGKKEPGSRPPVVVYTGKELSEAELERLRRYAESIILKGAKSPERLLDEVSLFLHRVEADLPKNSKSILQKLRGREEVFADRKILLVDDDMRNVFALANALDVKGMNVTIGKNGKEALDVLDKDQTIELVLMDIMMPLMDGYEAMEKIRGDRRFKKLPIIALTAKAMKGDQERCLAAGANDYLPKPIQLERLLSLLRVWLPPRNEL